MFSARDDCHITVHIVPAAHVEIFVSSAMALKLDVLGECTQTSGLVMIQEKSASWAMLNDE